MFGLGFGEILLILVIALLFIGPKKLPGLARSIGKGFREFQRARDGVMDELKKSVDENDLETDFQASDPKQTLGHQDLEANSTDIKTKTNINNDQEDKA